MTPSNTQSTEKRLIKQCACSRTHQSNTSALAGAIAHRARYGLWLSTRWPPDGMNYFSTVGFAAGTPQWSNAKRRPSNVGVAEGGFERRGPAFTIAGWRFPFNGLVEITSEDDSALVLADHAEVLRQKLSVTKPDPSCTQSTFHGPKRREASKLRSEPRAGPGFQERIWSSFVGRRQSWSDFRAGPERPAGRLIQKLGSRLTVIVKVRMERGARA